MQNNTRTHYPGCVSSFRSLLPSPSLFSPSLPIPIPPSPLCFSLSGALASLSLLWVQHPSHPSNPWASVPQQPLSPSLWSALAPPPTPSHPALPLQRTSSSTRHFNVHLSLRTSEILFEIIEKWISWWKWTLHILFSSEIVFLSDCQTEQWQCLKA